MQKTSCLCLRDYSKTTTEYTYVHVFFINKTKSVSRYNE